MTYHYHLILPKAKRQVLQTYFILSSSNAENRKGKTGLDSNVLRIMKNGLVRLLSR